MSIVCSTGHANRRRSGMAQRIEESISYFLPMVSLLLPFVVFVVFVVRRHRSMLLHFINILYFNPTFLFSTNQKKVDVLSSLSLSLSLSVSFFFFCRIFVKRKDKLNESIDKYICMYVSV